MIRETVIDNEPLNALLSENEKLLWAGKPQKQAYIFSQCITLMPIALIWLLFDGFAISSMVGFGNMISLWFLIPFFALHLLPVWLWLGSSATAKTRWDKTYYLISDKRIIIQTGLIGEKIVTIFFKDISNVDLQVGLTGRLFGVGDITFQTPAIAGGQHDVSGVFKAFLCLEDAAELYRRFQKIVLDIQTDVHYPNQLRPENNPGYNTEYQDK